MNQYEIWTEATRHGEAWGQQEEFSLESMARNHYTMSQMAHALNRTEYAIQCRLERLGLKAFPTKHHEKKERNIVNLNHLITLLQKGYTTCDVVFPGDLARKWTYKISDAMSKTVEKDTQVVVPVKEGDFKVAYIWEVHKEPKIDVKSPYAFKWVICKVDRASWDDQNRREKEAMEMLEQAERKKAQKDALDVLMENVDRERFIALLNGVEL